MDSEDDESEDDEDGSLAPAAAAGATYFTESSVQASRREASQRQSRLASLSSVLP